MEWPIKYLKSSSESQQTGVMLSVIYKAIFLMGIGKSQHTKILYDDETLEEYKTLEWDKIK